MSLKLIQTNVNPQDTELAISVKNYLINGNFVIGNPSLALKQTLKKLEEQKEKPLNSETDWRLRDFELERDIALTKAGIEGELELTEYISKLLKLEKDLFGIVAFASLSYETDTDKDYIPDTDIMLVYGKNVLIIDAKKLKTKASEEIYLYNNQILNAKGKELISFHSSTHFWRNIFKKNDIEIDSINGLVCIVNDTPIEIVKDENWQSSPTKLIHISELKQILKYWIKNKDNTLHLNILTEIAKAQVREEKSDNIDLNAFKRKFGV